jgi:hypothetical protein
MPTGKPEAIPSHEPYVRIDAPPHTVEFNITEILASNLPRPGDMKIEVKASVSGFVGRESCWVDADEFKIFAASAHRLHTSFAGIAELKSISPGELSLALSAADAPGYILIKVSIARFYPVSCSMSGQFEVELSAISQFVSWASAISQLVSGLMTPRVDDP